MASDNNKMIKGLAFEKAVLEILKNGTLFLKMKKVKQLKIAIIDMMPYVTTN